MPPMQARIGSLHSKATRLIDPRPQPAIQPQNRVVLQSGDDAVQACDLGMGAIEVSLQVVASGRFDPQRFELPPQLAALARFAPSWCRRRGRCARGLRRAACLARTRAFMARKVRPLARAGAEHLLGRPRSDGTRRSRAARGGTRTAAERRIRKSQSSKKGRSRSNGPTSRHRARSIEQRVEGDVVVEKEEVRIEVAAVRQATFAALPPVRPQRVDAHGGVRVDDTHARPPTRRRRGWRSAPVRPGRRRPGRRRSRRSRRPARSAPRPRGLGSPEGRYA